MKKEEKINYKFIFIFLFMISILFTLIYIFFTSDLFITTNSIINEVIMHDRLLNKTIILNNYFLDNNIYTLSIKNIMIPLGIFMKNKLLLTNVFTFLISILFFTIIFNFCKKHLGKKESLVLLLIFLSGISFNFLASFYVFYDWLVYVVNSMIVLYISYKYMLIEKNKLFYIVLLLIIFFISIGNLKYVISILVPFLLSSIILIKGKNNMKKKKIVGFIILIIITTITYFITYASFNKYKNISLKTGVKKNNITSKTESLLDINFGFFGFSNTSNTIIYQDENYSAVNQNKESSLYSIDGVFTIIKLSAWIFFIILTPILLYCNYKNNKKIVNQLLVFNSISWIIMIVYYYLFSNIYSNLGLNYFLFNFIINMILGIYLLFNYLMKIKLISIFCNLFLFMYILSNIFATSIIISENNKKNIGVNDNLIELLIKNNLKYGYSSYSNSFIISYLSNYKIQTIPVKFNKNIETYSNEKEDYGGRIFIATDINDINTFNKYIKKYGKPDKSLNSDYFFIFIYNKNPLKQ